MLEEYLNKIINGDCLEVLHKLPDSCQSAHPQRCRMGYAEELSIPKLPTKEDDSTE